MEKTYSVDSCCHKQKIASTACCIYLSMRSNFVYRCFRNWSEGLLGEEYPVPLSLKNLKRKSSDKRNNDVLLFAYLIYVSSAGRARDI